MSDTAIKRRLDELYAELPTIKCQQLCSEACGPIMMGRVEWQRICKKVGHEPQATSLVCPLLSSNGICTVYAIRPMICRLWGLIDADDMRCHHGCVPSRWLTREEGFEFLARARELQ